MQHYVLLTTMRKAMKLDVFYHPLDRYKKEIINGIETKTLLLGFAILKRIVGGLPQPVVVPLHYPYRYRSSNLVPPVVSVLVILRQRRPPTIDFRYSTMTTTIQISQHQRLIMIINFLVFLTTNQYRYRSGTRIYF